MPPRVKLGSSGIEVCPIAFGTWQLSPRFWGPQPREQVMDAMRAAFDAGIDCFDTADAYGDGLAEEALGEFLATVQRDRVVVVTKVFNHFNLDGSRHPDLSPGHIAERCEVQLRRLRTDHIDLYLLHFWDPLTPLADVAGAMEGLVRQGKVRQIGVSNFNVEQLRAARRAGPFHVIQSPYSLIDPAIEADLLPYCAAEGVGVMAYSPMHKGLLTGKYSGDETFGDFRQHHRDFQGERFRQLAQGVRSLAPMAERYGLTRYQLVLAATLTNPALQVAVVGVKDRAQIAEAVGAWGKTIDRRDYFAIRAAVSPQPAKVTDATGKVK